MRRRSTLILLGLATFLSALAGLRWFGSRSGSPDNRPMARSGRPGKGDGPGARVAGDPKGSPLPGSPGQGESPLGGHGATAEGDSGTWQGPATRGTVIAEGGAPVAGALVLLGDLDSLGETELTGPDGRFGIDQLAFYSTVHAFAVRGNEVWQGEEPADGFPLDLTVTLKPPATPRDRTVLVHVVGPDGRPIPRGQAAAVAGRARDYFPLKSTEKGTLAIVGGWFPVSARCWREGEKPTFLIRSVRDEAGWALPFGSALVTVDPAGPAVVEVRLPAGGLVLGRVLLPDGSPAAGTQVLFRGPLPEGFRMEGTEGPRPESILTDEAGGFDFGADGPGRGTVLVERGVRSGEEHGGSGEVPVTVGGPEVVVRLRRAILLRILVCDEQGSPVPLARVGVEGDDGKAITDTNGACGIPGLPEGEEVTLTVEHADFVTHRSRCVASEQDMRVALQRCGLIDGRVVGPDGAPVEDVALFVDPPGMSEVSWWTTMGESARTFGVANLPAGARVRLSLTDGERRFGTVEAVVGGPEVTLAWPAEEDRLTLILGEVEGEWRTGVVLRDGGRVIASVDRPGPAVSIPSKGLPPLVDIQVGPTKGGRYAFLPRVPSHGFRRVALQKARSLEGRVAAKGGEPVEFARCLATTEAGFVVEFETDIEGKFDVAGIPEGSLRLRATSFDGRTGMVEVELPADEVLVELPVR